MLEIISNVHLLTFFELVLIGTATTVRGVIDWRNGTYTDGFRQMLYLTVGAGIVQALLGTILFLGGCRPNNLLHLVYGLIVVAAVPVAFTYANEKIGKRDLAILAFAAFAIVAAAVRALITGTGGVCPI